MTPLNTIIEEEKKEFDERFSVVTLEGETHICDFENQETIDLYEPIKSFLTTAMQRAYEAGRKEEGERALEKTQAEQESKTTPNAEWESVEDYVREFQKMALTFVVGEGEIEKMARLSNFFLDALTSRDTYWKERVRSKREDLAELEHDQWIAWSKNIAETEQITPARLERWKELWRPYAELTEAEKDQDREWADQALDTLLDNLK